MPSSFSTDLKLELMVTGENAGTWGSKTNDNLNVLQQAIAGFKSISIAGGAQTTALLINNSPDIATSDARNAVIKLTGTITGNQIVTVPNGIEKTYIIENNTTGAFTVEFKTAGGTGTTWSTTDKGIKILFTDGTNIVDVNADLSASTFASISSGQIDILAQAELRLQDTTGGQYVGFKAPGTVSSSYTLTLPTATGTAGQTLVTNGSGVLSFAASGLAWQSVKTANFTAVKGEAYPINTTSSAITVTLPATPSAGDQVQVVDYAGTADTFAIIIDGNGEDIEGTLFDFKLSGEREGVILTYIDSTQGWIATSGINEGTDALAPTQFTADFLVIAGGGGAGGQANLNAFGGGGGAGGYRELTATTLDSGTNYTVTVGGGGPGGNNNNGTKGVDSVFSTTTSTGGGRGGASLSPGGAGTGGSGGGGSSFPGGNTGGAGNTPSTSPSQGNNGGNGTGNQISTSASGGGGGASAVGVNASSSTGGNGGAGTTSSITGPAVTRAGGGGGAGTVTQGSGGNGGGGAGVINAGGGAAGAGSVNTGGGGGGGGYTTSDTVGGAGGSGIVIIKYPDIFTITNPGGGLTSSTSTAGGFKITSFTAGTGTIQFN